VIYDYDELGGLVAADGTAGPRWDTCCSVAPAASSWAGPTTRTGCARPPQHRTPKSMGFTPVDGPDGFGYAWA
jgi:hypothetical protein